MKADERRAAMMALLMERGTASVEELSQRFRVSKMTVHRDLDELEASGQLRKMRGGASVQSSAMFQADFRYRQKIAAGEKARIAAAAAAFIEPGMTLMIDDSSTAANLAAHLSQRLPLTVISNNLSVISELAGVAGIELMALGGQYSRKFNGFFGLLTEDALRGLRADIGFISASAIYEGEAFHQDPEVVQTKRLIVKGAERRVLLADHTKFGRPGLHFLTGLETFSAVLTGDELDEAQRAVLTEKGVSLHCIPA
ncbi:DeoR/GlpR family DNA-binding transcription regulator [Martelella sp. AD-3]|uniref:DeoR/GlpR family DNA-binding transcription regulator n=1 Tax=Martelella sp. AD-3 TaxID=686597 RepID=UPI000464E810|nr:DeoR/GlpR family DNA-binding transcription regulator [Martelella sp. AD-3]AMM83683.1 DeoR family transcriptional regulator [Martelella sp. AD-3]MAM12343.1 DeoR/GlpR transcriptional regulator [Rhizobiaceae bacterium]